jgi:hypothetical protein
MNGLSFPNLFWLGLKFSYGDVCFAISWYQKCAAVLLCSLLVIFILLIEGNWYRTKSSVLATTNVGTVMYRHASDERTTGIINYHTGQGPFPESERLPLYRQYIKNRLEEAKMEVPADFHTLDWYGVNTLAITWYKKNYPKHPKDKETLQKIIDRLFGNSVSPPLEGFSPNVKDNLWGLLRDIDAPKVRWIEEQDDLPSRFVAYSASDKQSFYYPVDHTIYIRYDDSVKNLLDEVGHVKQFRDRPLWSYTRMGFSMLTAWIGAEFDVDRAIEIYKLRYKDPSTFEGEAHGPIKDALLSKHRLILVEKQVSAKD